jgi:hypothetical protein
MRRIGEWQCAPPFFPLSLLDCPPHALLAKARGGGHDLYALLDYGRPGRPLMAHPRQAHCADPPAVPLPLARTR